MKYTFLTTTLFMCICIIAGFAQDNFRVPKKLDVTPATYLEELKVKDTNRRLLEREKESLCRLFTWAYQTSKKRYNQDYNIGLNTPIYKLFKVNFPGVSKVEREVIFLGSIHSYILESPECQAVLNRKKGRAR